MGAGRRTLPELPPPPGLFQPGELWLRPTGLARLRSLARRPAPSETAKQRRLKEDREAIRKLREYGLLLVRQFGLRLAVVEPERDGVNSHYGICYEDGLIRIRLRHARTGRLLKESSLVDTLCHELAHLRHMNHGLRFRRLYLEILEAARGLGYYRPGPAASAVRQRSLFEDEACGTRH